MNGPNQCAKCGGPLPEDGAPGGRCPGCLSSEPDLQRTMTVAPTAAAAPPSGAERRMPATIARYRIVRLIGEGGMGAVYEAEQDQPRRTVALKVIKPGMASPALLRRFEQEAQALGRLQHPGIAQIYEAGTADTGFGPQPYFAMEFIRGSSLREYVEQHRLNTRERLEMMAKVCDAVHHAHQRSLIHRDLKPANILVDETGQPKILDFGVARVTDRDAQATSQTDVGQLIGTLAYMSPEQVSADPLELDTRSDVYALGVILYELLAGQLPYNIGDKLHEALHAIREQDPNRLSSLSRAYKGDVETIVAKALEKDKARRYSSAADLAADIRRYLTDEPIEARHPSLGYQLQKFARRHTAMVAGVAAVFVVLVAGIAASSWQAVRASRAEQAAVLGRDRAVQAEKTTAVARDQAVQSQQAATAAEAQARKDRDQAVEQKQRADTEAASETAVSAFWQENLVAQAKDGDLSMRAALDQAAAKIKADDKQPLVEAKVRESVAKAYMVLSAWAPAQQQMERALAIRRRVQGEEHPDTLETKTSLAALYLASERTVDAESLLNGILEIRRRTLGEEHPDTLSTRVDLANLYQATQQFEKAETLLKEVLQVRRRVLGPEHRDTLLATYFLANCYVGQGKPELAQPLLKTIVGALARTPGEMNPIAEVAASELRLTERAIELKAKQAEPTQADIASFLGDAAKAFPSDFSSLPQMLGQTMVDAQFLLQGGKLEQAVELLNSRLEIVRRAGSENGPLVAVLVFVLAGSYNELKKYPEAEANYLKSIEILRKAGGPEDSTVLSYTRPLATLYRNQGKFADSEALLVKLVEVERRTPGEGNQTTRVDMEALAQVYQKQGKYGQSEEMYNQLLDAQRRSKSEALRIAVTQSSIGWVRLQQKRYAEAEAVLREAANSLEATAPAPWEKFNIESMLGASLAGQKKYTEAEPLLLSGYDGMTQQKPTTTTSSRFTQEQAGDAIVNLYQAWGKPEKAAEWKKKLQAPN